MSFPILGLHHVTATVDDAQADLDFSVDALGLRLVKKTVNFDNRGVTTSTTATSKESPGRSGRPSMARARGVATGTKGAGQVTVTSFSVPAGSPTRKSRLRERGLRDRRRPASAKNPFSSPIHRDSAIELIATIATRALHGRRAESTRPPRSEEYTASR